MDIKKTPIADEPYIRSVRLVPGNKVFINGHRAFVDQISVHWTGEEPKIIIPVAKADMLPKHTLTLSFLLIDRQLGFFDEEARIEQIKNITALLECPPVTAHICTKDSVAYGLWQDILADNAGSESVLNQDLDVIIKRVSDDVMTKRKIDRSIDLRPIADNVVMRPVMKRGQVRSSLTAAD